MAREEMELEIIAQLRFEALHHWPGAVDHAETYLAFPHRHEFHVRVEMQTWHDDREVEFIQLKREVWAFLRRRLKIPGTVIDLGTTSCEALAQQIIEFLVDEYGEREMSVEVLEDGENGGRAYYWPPQEEEGTPLGAIADTLGSVRCAHVFKPDDEHTVVQCEGELEHEGPHKSGAYEW